MNQHDVNLTNDIPDVETMNEDIETTGGTIPPENAMPRMTITDTVYWQPVEGEPSVVSMQSSMNLTTDEEPYHRSLKVGEKWQPLDQGWIKDGSYLVIQNPLTQREKNPTEQEVQIELAQTIELSFRADGFVDCKVQAGHSMRLNALHLNNISLRCKQGTRKVQVSIFPL